MIRIKPLHTRIFNDILSLVTKPQCGISVYVSYRVLLTHCQEPFSGHPTELVCFDAVVAVPSGPSVLCIDLLYRLLYCFNQPTAELNLWWGGRCHLWHGKKNVWKTQERQNPSIFLLVQSLFYSIVLPFLYSFFFFFFCWCCTLGSVTLSCCSPVASRPHLRSR